MTTLTWNFNEFNLERLPGGKDCGFSLAKRLNIFWEFTVLNICEVALSGGSNNYFLKTELHHLAAAST